PREKVLFKKASDELKDFIIGRYTVTKWDCEDLLCYLEKDLKEKVEWENEKRIYEEVVQRVITESIAELKEKFRRENLVRAKMRARVMFRKQSLKCYKCGMEGNVVSECRFGKEIKDKVKEKPKYRKITKEEDEFSKEQMIKQLKEVHGEVLSNDKEIKYCNLEKCRIETENGLKVVKKGQRVQQSLFKKTRSHIHGLLERGVIRRSDSDWRNPIRAIEKPNGNVRLVSNFMALNDLVKKDPYNLVNIRDVIRATQGSEYFTVVDLKEAFYHIEIEEGDKFKTAFEFEGEVFEWNSMVMGF
ncbi:Transposon Tf2-11 polyprotein, partial [Nosema granulosis]